MQLKLMGAFFVVAGCGGFGFSMAASHRRSEAQLKQYLRALERMQWELSFRQPPLFQLCALCAETAGGPVGQLFARVSEELEQRLLADAGACVDKALEAVPGLCEEIRIQARLLGESLGQFDLPGQLRGLESAINQGSAALSRLETNRENRLRSYQTLGLCAGAALAILFL